MARVREGLALGLDFGTDSVRALLVDFEGNERAAAVVKYRHGQIVERLPTSGERLPEDFALQHPSDWLESAARAVRQAMRRCRAEATHVLGIGVDFTSCTMLPALEDGTPLCLVDPWQTNHWAWPKLWKHHGAKRQTDRLNQIARERQEPWLDRYGGQLGLEWFWPKVLETLQVSPEVYRACDVWIEAGDWLVWQLVGGPASELPRSTCQAGYKACWSRQAGYPSAEFFRQVDRRLEHVVARKMPGRMLAPGTPAGTLMQQMSKRFGLAEGTPVSAAVIDAHAGVPGAGVSGEGTLVMVMGTSSCHMINSSVERSIPGVAGVVQDGILPGYYGYETGQASVGDAFQWLRRLVGHRDFRRLDQWAAEASPGQSPVVAVDWLNGCRTPWMDGSLRGLLAGLTLGQGPGEIYRALIEATAFGARVIVELLEEGGIAVRRCVATGGLPHHNPLLVSIYADVLGRPILVHPSKHGPALGAAILGAIAAGDRTGLGSPEAAIRRMAGAEGAQPVKPDRSRRRDYGRIYDRYRYWCDAVRAERGRNT